MASTPTKGFVRFAALPMNVQKDVKDFVHDNPRAYIELGDIMATENVLEAYLQWNGIIGYTRNIMSIFESSE